MIAIVLLLWLLWRVAAVGRQDQIPAINKLTVKMKVCIRTRNHSRDFDQARESGRDRGPRSEKARGEGK